ncbi:MAG: FAD-dependent oxidoreductase, partial [Phycisphaerae bacterium]
MAHQVEQQIRGFTEAEHEVDICVVGGGMAGMIAAMAAARHGARVALVHDRPVLGGNASSEVRMWICGAHGRDNKETGILEEIQLENCYRNSRQIYSIWDNVLYEKVAFCSGLKLFLNTTCNRGQMAHGRLASITCWQLTTQTWHTIHARYFIDCSGDSVLAPITGASVRLGRESRAEFDEDIQPPHTDNRTMGNSLLIQARETDEPQPYVAPKWAYKFRSAADLPQRTVWQKGDNFWWLEVGGLSDTIRDAETIRDELMKIGLGVWDYIKNHHEKRSEHENWGLEWFGALPGKRENRRYVGDHVLTQNDVRAEGKFPDLVAYGGWSMDDHHPGGLYYPGQPTIFHPAPTPFGIPYRTLYS